MAEKIKTCVICGVEFTEFGNNPEPLVSYDVGRCCDVCNAERVIPARLAGLPRFKGDSAN